jgi:hypothetical protein
MAINLYQLLLLLTTVAILVVVVRGCVKSAHWEARVDRKLDAIARHVGATEVSPGVLELVRDGKRVEAAQLYREQTGVEVKEAWDYVESLLQ